MGNARARRCVSTLSLWLMVCLRYFQTRDMLGDNAGAASQWRGNALPLNGVQSTANTDIRTTEDAKSISSVIPEPPQSNRPTIRKPRKRSKLTAPTPASKTVANASAPAAADANKTRKEQKRIARASQLRKQYPNMQNIPKSITPSQRKKLIFNHTQSATNTLQPIPSGTAEVPKLADPTSTAQLRKAANREKQVNRANLLKQQYPDMEGVPSKIGRGIRKKLIAQYQVKSSALAPSVTISTSSNTIARTNLPTRPILPPATSGVFLSTLP